MAQFPTSLVAAGGLVGGYAAARWTGKRPLGGVVLAAAGTLAAREWHRRTSPTTTALLGAAYVAAFAASHPLAKKIGAWPAVFTSAAAVAATTYATADR
ncbi:MULTISPECIES: hypothetical protein [Streptomyces]|uniref:hypothetical protein n=1 Tax=Streptomyces TaxID=1883 RepID=UPI0004BD28BB|nr:MULTISPECIES: hypothetical protein [Streptomyces]KOU09826.1 membrane protein [Streptomyces sp. WM6349]KOV08525.1 membrane protein [Streptomyces sp. XY533]KOV43859.1 membrane protein [Streptomyces sp. H036]MCI4081713.1 hypothetical protein [Streptomyces sp. MMS21 TC-5]MEC4575949.1 hypothetical protein [Streptomyces sp. CMAA1738]